MFSFEPFLFAWSGKVVDKETGTPIEGAVIVRSWNKESMSPAGSLSGFFTSNEALTNKNGKFSISFKKRFSKISLPILEAIVENNPIVYKPGYKFHICEKKGSIIKLEKIPILLELRKQEIDHIRGNYIINAHESLLLMSVIAREEEFIQSDIEAYRVNKFISTSLGSNQNYGVVPINSVHMDNKNIAALVSLSKMSKTNNTTDKTDQNRFDICIRILQDSSLAATVRGRAAKELGEIKDERAVSALVTALSDEQLIVRQYAAIALHKMNDPRGIEILLKDVNDKNSTVQIGSIRILRELKDPIAVPVLMNALMDEDYYVRRCAVEALAEFDDPREIELIRPMIEKLGDKDEKIRQTAKSTLEQIGLPAVEPVIEALKSDDTNKQREAALILGHLKDQRAVDPLINLLLEGKKGVSGSAATALNNYNDEKVITALVKSLGSGDTDLRNSASSALLKIGSPVLNQLYQEITSANPIVRQRIVEMLQTLKDDRSIDPLINVLHNDPEEIIRKLAAIALGNFNTTKVADALIKALSDENCEVRKMAADSIIKVGTPSVELLLENMHNADSYMRWRAAWCLGRIKDPKAIKPLLELLNDTVPEVKWTAIGALELIKDKSTLEPLRKVFFSETDSGLLKKAGRAISKIME